MSLYKTLTTLFIFSLSPVLFASQNETSASTSNNTFPNGLINLPSHQLISDYIFTVDKNAKELYVYQAKGPDLTLAFKFPTDIGKGKGDKLKQGDFKTPEGIYFLEKKLTGKELDFSQYGSIAFTTSYPNYFDMKGGKTGNGIWLHAIPDTVPLTRGSRGCVVVRNNVIQSLASIIDLNKTPILIYDKIDFVEKAQIASTKASVIKFLDAWKKSWEAQNMDEYMSYYDLNFTAKKMNFDQWKKYKIGLNYTNIKVEFSEPVILKNKDKILIKTYQKYTSDKHTDFGVKTIYALENSNGIKILGEDWEPTEEAKVTGLLLNNTTSTTKNN